MKTALLSAMLAAAVTLAGSLRRRPSRVRRLPRRYRAAAARQHADRAGGPAHHGSGRAGTPHAALPRKVRVVLASPYAVR